MMWPILISSDKDEGSPQKGKKTQPNPKFGGDQSCLSTDTPALQITELDNPLLAQQKNKKNKKK